MGRKTRTWVSAGCAAIALLLGGCSGSSSDDASKPAASKPAASTAPAVQSAPSLTPAPAPSPLVQAKAVSDGYGTDLTLAPVTLNRRGNFLFLELAATVTKATGQNANLSILFVHGQLDLPVTLVDPVHGKRYLPAKDSEGGCLCTNFTGGVTVGVGQTGILSAYFANPPADVTSLDIDLPKVATFTSVPIR